MNKTILTITIVTRDRVELFEKCMKNLSTQDLTSCQVVIVDNSLEPLTFLNKMNIAQNYLGTKCTLLMVPSRNLPESRNLAIELSKGQFVTILDDDDYFTEDGVKHMVNRCIEYEDSKVDMMSFVVLKEGRSIPDKFTTPSVKNISTYNDRVAMLNNFDNYSEDQFTKIFLWNTAHVFRTSHIKRNNFWKYLGCDDIIPITSAYISAREIIHDNTPVYIYPVQTTIHSEMSPEQIDDLIKKMMLSYLELYERFPDTTKLLAKSVYNSYRQIQYFHRTDSKLLDSLKNVLEFKCSIEDIDS